MTQYLRHPLTIMTDMQQQILALCVIGIPQNNSPLRTFWLTFLCVRRLRLEEIIDARASKIHDRLERAT